nr:Chain C, SER-PRO-SER-TYR-VAL-TYR-HIS-GLN-PHE [Homo sapiens]6L9M_F Chain F, SER-PRO-SER-TYR-VAL-TYR-HIS-GLN-PHE [Homo sapiens]6L9M_I Chain I, SER-PRO-SER-TYR-VAL-TYR-HIS-GLN-PHE [Homo sapiens]6L9M_L Chain L, SER-PRO-SER-TYR-VAL-TYR-HIS-GLN-PHE [Homo sapiens]
SPSYVYHQF